MQQHSVKYEKQLCNSNKKPSNNLYSKGPCWNSTLVKDTYLILLLKYVLCIVSNYKQNPDHSRKQQLRTIVQRNARRYKILPDC